jgi:catechol 2,3-dioxygenase-like lactoylglutathione lyase family enzyme
MAQIRHIAISSDDTEKLTRFYKEVFGFRQSRPTPEGRKTTYLTEGYIPAKIKKSNNFHLWNGVFHNNC